MNRRRRVRIGYIEYLNALPFYHGLAEHLKGENPPEFVRGVPAEMNRLMRNGKLDMALVSSLEYAMAPDRYYVLTDLCVGSYGSTGSVVLFSKLPLGKLDGRSVVLSKESLSSANLLRILLKMRWGYTNHFTTHSGTLSRLLSKGDAALVIGDQAFSTATDTALFRYDLSEEWWNWQNLPFCFALWAAQRSFCDRQPERARKVATALENLLDRNIRSMEEWAGRVVYARKNMDADRLIAYLRSLAYRLDPEMLKGLERFYELARQMEMVDREIVLEYAPFETVGVK